MNENYSKFSQNFSRLAEILAELFLIHFSLAGQPDYSHSFSFVADKEPVLPCCGKSRNNIHHSTALDELNPKMYFIFAKWQFRDFRKPIDFATQDSTFRFEMTWTGMRNVVE